MFYFCIKFSSQFIERDDDDFPPEKKRNINFYFKNDEGEFPLSNFSSEECLASLICCVFRACDSSLSRLFAVLPCCRGSEAKSIKTASFSHTHRLDCAEMQSQSINHDRWKGNKFCRMILSITNELEKFSCFFREIVYSDIPTPTRLEDNFLSSLASPPKTFLVIH